jgi:hypothetical protein
MKTTVNPKGHSKTVAFTLDDKTISMLKFIAEINSNSMSHEIRRLIKTEFELKS